MKTREEVENLKRIWEYDPCWNIEETEGFGDYELELLEYRKNMEKEREEDEFTRKTNKQIELGIQGNNKLLQYLESLEHKIKNLEEEIEKQQEIMKWEETEEFLFLNEKKRSSLGEIEIQAEIDIDGLRGEIFLILKMKRTAVFKKTIGYFENIDDCKKKMEEEFNELTKKIPQDNYIFQFLFENFDEIRIE